MPPAFRMVGDLMLMEHLDVSGVQGLLTIGFRFTDDATELWTRRFNAFKAKDSPAVEAGARTISQAFRSINLPGRVVVVGAISSSDHTLSPQAPVYLLGNSIADTMHWEWAPTLLDKDPHQRLHNIYNAGDRDAEVRGRYRSRRTQGEPGTFLIVDDFCTRGSTLSDITRALCAANPRWATYGVTLAKTERVGYWGQQNISNAHIPHHLSEIWANR